VRFAPCGRSIQSHQRVQRTPHTQKSAAELPKLQDFDSAIPSDRLGTLGNSLKTRRI
jgi:hypothetical protein